MCIVVNVYVCEVLKHVCCTCLAHPSWHFSSSWTLKCSLLPMGLWEFWFVFHSSLSCLWAGMLCCPAGIAPLTSRQDVMLTLYGNALQENITELPENNNVLSGLQNPMKNTKFNLPELKKIWTREGNIASRDNTNWVKHVHMYQYDSKEYSPIHYFLYLLDPV